MQTSLIFGKLVLITLIVTEALRIDAISLSLPVTGLVNEDIVKSIKNQKQARKQDLKSVNDFKLMLMSMVFDLNFRVSFQLLNEKQLIKKLYDSLPKKDTVIDAYRGNQTLYREQVCELALVKQVSSF